MTDNVNVSDSTSQNQNLASSTAQNNSVAVGSDAAAEKLLKQSEVNDLVGKAKHAAYEKGKQEALATLQSTQQNTAPNVQPTVNQQSQNSGLPPQLTPEQQQQIAQQAVQMLQNAQAIEQFKFKMNAGTQKYSDFEKVVTSLNLPNIPDVVQLANSFENTADIMYDLGKPGNEAKIANLRVLAQINPHKAFEAMQSLSNSIKQNQQAEANQPKVNEPLSQIKPSNVGIDNGSKTVADLRRSSYLRA